MKLGEHFDEREFGVNLPDQVKQNYHLLCKLILDKLRNQFGVVQITSGYRRPKKNEMVGGVTTSQHLLGEAVDFYCPHAPDGMGPVYFFIINDLHWLGEVFLYRRKGHIHLGLPRFNIKVDQAILDE